VAKYPTLTLTLRVHDYLIQRYGGGFGIRDVGPIRSALEAPRNTAAYGSHSIADQAVALLHAITKNHGFIDGNKRTAFAMFDVFLRRNGYRVRFPPKAWADIVEELADGTIMRKQVLTHLLLILPRRGMSRRPPL
jgi:death-on-curing protein